MHAYRYSKIDSNEPAKCYFFIKNVYRIIYILKGFLEIDPLVFSTHSTIMFCIKYRLILLCRPIDKILLHDILTVHVWWYCWRVFFVSDSFEVPSLIITCFYHKYSMGDAVTHFRGDQRSLISNFII